MKTVLTPARILLILLLSAITLSAGIVKCKFDYSSYPDLSNVSHFLVYSGDSSGSYNQTNNTGKTNIFYLDLDTPKYLAVSCVDSNNFESELSNEIYSAPYLAINLSNNLIQISVKPINQILIIQNSTNFLFWNDYTTNNVFELDKRTNNCMFFRIRFVENY